jgi:hypothetical protein
MSHLLYRSVDGDRHISRPETEQKPLGCTEATIFLGMVILVILFIIAADRWEVVQTRKYQERLIKSHHSSDGSQKSERMSNEN